MSARLGLGGLGGGVPEEPPPTHRGEAPPRSFADLPRGGGDLLPTPRGRRGAEPEPEDETRSSKKPREEEGGGGAAADDGGAISSKSAASDGGTAAVFAYPDWDEIPMFTRGDFEPQCAFAILCRDAEGTPGRLVMWVGDESGLSEERDSDIIDIGKEFALELELPSALPVELLFEADAEEGDPLYEYFSHE